MVMTAMRFNFILPGLDPKTMSGLYQAALEMVSYGEQNGIDMVTHEEHHGAENGWSPSPLVTAGMILSRTSKVMVFLSALLVPLHDPLRVAEDIAVLDLASGGRFSFIAGVGYRPSEFAAHGKDWSRRGELMDEAIDVMLKAWTGEPFEYRGTTVRVTPLPLTQPHPPMMLGGTAKVSARRAARFGLPFFPADNMPELEAYYYQQCTVYGTEGLCMLPSASTAMVFVADDPDKAWAEIGPNLLHEAVTYAGWQTPDIRSIAHSHATTVDELRAEGKYAILTPAEVIEDARAAGDLAAINLHPLCGGIPVDVAWGHLQLLVDKVLPELR
ncbi:MAG TPA: LLM class flavin-dependent oxidoreductase [Acidimicrobiales bacterium]|nr:LLM class flavin-dependent oxidoreductase [Acidimicrobiales bacterium]